MAEGLWFFSTYINNLKVNCMMKEILKLEIIEYINDLRSNILVGRPIQMSDPINCCSLGLWLCDPKNVDRYKELPEFIYCKHKHTNFHNELDGIISRYNKIIRDDPSQLLDFIFKVDHQIGDCMDILNKSIYNLKI